MKIIKSILIPLILFIVVGLIGYEVGKRKSVTLVSSAPLVQENTQLDTEGKKFPPLKMPADYFDANKISGGANSEEIGYSVLLDADSYRSYPTTVISLPFNSFSNTLESLPPIKSDAEIHTANPEDDFMGSSKDNSIKAYGDLARRFVGVAGDGSTMGNVQNMDFDNDGKKEISLSIAEMGANVIGERSVIIKGDKIIFSTTEDTFSSITPAKNGNGFFLRWDDNYKQRDGYTVTRFIYQDGKFAPVYEQQTRYIRITTQP